MKGLQNLKDILEKGKTRIQERYLDESELLETCLIPDKFSLIRQVQIASDNAKGVSARIYGRGKLVLDVDDTEKSFDALIEHYQKTIAFLETLTPEQFDESEKKLLSFPYIDGKAMTGYDTLLQSSLTNFFFHVTTAYNIFRYNGVSLGKADYVGILPLK